MISALASTTMSYHSGGTLLCLLTCEIMSLYLAQAALELRSFLPQPPKSWPCLLVSTLPLLTGAACSLSLFCLDFYRTFQIYLPDAYLHGS